jgi:hypothetical protein
MMESTCGKMRGRPLGSYRRGFVAFLYALASMPLCIAVAEPAAVLTHHNDNARTGANLNETSLNVTNVNTNTFGLLYTRTVNDQLYAQPLVMTNVNIPGKGIHNIVIVATVNDTVYAFDADDPTVVTPYWQVSFLGPNVVAPATDDILGSPCGSFRNISGNFGIIGTPVIDPVAGTIFVAARTKEFNTNYVQRLHALNVATGAERSNSPVVITATYPGNGTGSISGVLTFDPYKQNQRPALALVSGVVYIGWASHCDWDPYHGWLIGYNATNLQREVVYNTAPNGHAAGIWMAGEAPSADSSGNIYLSVGNGTVGTNGNPRDTINRGESFLKLTRSGTNLTVASWFTPNNYSTLEASDIDLGSAGLLLIPGTNLAFSAGKQGIAYLVKRDNMGGLSFSSSDTNVVQTITLASDGVYGSPVWWDGPSASFGYIWPASDYLQQYKFDRVTNMFVLPKFARSPTPAPSGHPGGFLALSANGTNAGSGIVWASHQLGSSAQGAIRPGILHAYNAENVTNELWNSELLSRDSVGNFAKFVPPTVANGKVYLATFSNRLNVYGLFTPPALNINRTGNTVMLSWTTNGVYTYTLQVNSNVVAGTWANVTNSVGVSNGLFQVTVPAPTSGAPAFYRLKR